MMSEKPVAEDSTGAAVHSFPLSLCRLCLREYPRDDLCEIFSRDSQWKKHIARAVGIKPNRNDPATQMCSTCRMMVELIVSFQDFCQQTERLMNKGSHEFCEGDSSWKQASGLIDSLCGLMERHQKAVLKTCEPPLIVETEQEMFNVCVPNDEEQDELLLEIKVEQEKVEDEDEQTEDQDYDFEVQLEDDGDETDEEEEEEKPKRKRGRKKQDDPERQSKNEKVKCDICGELVTQIAVEGHLNRHLGVRPFVCEIEGCGKRLISKYSVEQHQRVHKILRFYDCAECGKRIKSPNWLPHRKLHDERKLKSKS